jgi:hypothetical protein
MNTNPRNELIAGTEGWARKYVAAEVAYYAREIEALRSIAADDGSIARGFARAQAVIKAETARDAAESFGDMLCWDAAVMGQAGLSSIAEAIIERSALQIKTARAKIVIGEVKAGRKVPPIRCAYQPHTSTSPAKDLGAI